MTTSAGALGFPQTRARSRVDALQIAITAVLLTYVWRVQDLVPGLGALKLPTIATLAAVVLLLLDPRVARRYAAVRHHRIVRILGWFVVIGGVSVLFSIAKLWSGDFFLRGFVPAIALAVIVPLGIFAAQDGVRFAAIQVAGATLYCIAVLLRFEVDATGRLSILLFYDANDIGMLLVCTLPLCAFFVRHAKLGISRVLALGITLLFLVTIARTGSRGAFLGLLVVGAYVLFYFRSARLSTRALLVAGTSAVLLLGAGAKYRESMSTILSPTVDYNWVGRADAGRMSIWRRGIDYAKRFPLTGVGVNAFPVAEGTISPLAERQEYGRGVKWSTAHNSFIQVLAELGVPGFIAFLLILGGSWRIASRLSRESMRSHTRDTATGELANAHAAALVGFAVSGFFLSQAYAPYLYFVIGMIIGLDVTMRSAWRREAPQRAARSSGARGWRTALPVHLTTAGPAASPAATPRADR